MRIFVKSRSKQEFHNRLKDLEERGAKVIHQKEECIQGNNNFVYLPGRVEPKFPGVMDNIRYVALVELAPRIVGGAT